jgi:hypothetical protein
MVNRVCITNGSEKKSPSHRFYVEKKNVASLGRALRRLYGGYRSARVGQPVISELTLSSLARSLSPDDEPAGDSGRSLYVRESKQGQV